RLRERAPERGESGNVLDDLVLGRAPGLVRRIEVGEVPFVAVGDLRAIPLLRVGGRARACDENGCEHGHGPANDRRHSIRIADLGKPSGAARADYSRTPAMMSSTRTAGSRRASTAGSSALRSYLRMMLTRCQPASAESWRRSSRSPFL